MRQLKNHARSIQIDLLIYILREKVNRNPTLLALDKDLLYEKAKTSLNKISDLEEEDYTKILIEVVKILKI